MIVRRAHERAHSLKTGFPFTESSSPETKHCLSLLTIRREQEGQQIEAIYLFAKDSAEIGAARVWRWSRDVLRLSTPR